MDHAQGQGLVMALSCHGEAQGQWLGAVQVSNALKMAHAVQLAGAWRGAQGHRTGEVEEVT